jgi:hypothetical protein
MYIGGWVSPRAGLDGLGALEKRKISFRKSKPDFSVVQPLSIVAKPAELINIESMYKIELVTF